MVRRRYVPSLDGVRAIAIAAVFLLHLDRAHFPGGGLGVDVFFVLSGYLITSILADEFHEHRRIDLFAFYWRRLVRLGPALVLWVALVATPTAILAHAGQSIGWSVGSVVTYSTDFFQAWSRHIASAYDQSWSLAVEEQFYLVWPALLVGLLLLRPPAQRVMFGGIVIASMSAMFAVPSYFLPTGHLAALALGCGAALYATDARVAPSTLVAGVCVAALAVATLVSPSGRWAQLVALGVAGASTLLIVHCASRQSALSAALGSRAFTWVGERSYGIYLYGLTTMQTVALVTHLPLHLAAPIDLCLTGLLAWASHRFVEAPIRARGRAWLGRRDARPMGIVGAASK